MPTCAATSPATRSADRNDASQTTNTPSGKFADEAAMTASDNAVFPTPPGPLTVVSEEELMVSATSASSRSLPTSRRGRLAPPPVVRLRACKPFADVALTLAVSHLGRDPNRFSTQLHAVGCNLRTFRRPGVSRTLPFAGIFDLKPLG